MFRMSRDGFVSNHDKCREGQKCVGPGCKVATGKTAQDRMRNVKYRPRVLAWQRRQNASKMARMAENGTL